ncbi:MAG: hypothetical protein AAF915_01980 [Cyanobacteria bacterium P01_D01_bin.50]
MTTKSVERVKFKSLKCYEMFTLSPNSPFLWIKISRNKAVRLKDKKEVMVNDSYCYKTKTSSS